MDQKKFSLKFQALKQNYNENFIIKEIKEVENSAAAKVAQNAVVSKKVRRSKIERSNSKTKY